jgi:hypothetical protein
MIHAMHREVTGQILNLLDGLYSNVEDGLFELAYRSGDDGQRRRCFDLMRELRFRRGGLVKGFAKIMDKAREHWFESANDVPDQQGQSLDQVIMRLAEKSQAHFGGVLQSICERTAVATGRDFAPDDDLPISPRRVSHAFVRSCRSLKLDDASIEIVMELFARFVLDGLGNIYGDCNLKLQAEGFLTADEIMQASRA